MFSFLYQCFLRIFVQFFIFSMKRLRIQSILMNIEQTCFCINYLHICVNTSIQLTPNISKPSQQCTRLIYNKSPKRMSLTQHLLTQTSNIDIYNPYQSPASIALAQKHRNATKVGFLIERQNDDENTNNIKDCICCGNQIDKKQISLMCSQDQLLFLGVGYSLFFKLFFYFGIILSSVFVVSGSGFYLLATLNCVGNCVYFLYVPILDLSQPSTKYSILFDITHLVIGLLILILCLYIRKNLQSQIHTLQQKSISPQDYTLILQNLPDQLSQQQIIEFCKQKFNIKPIIVNFVYNLSQLQDAVQQRLYQTIVYNRLQIKKKEITMQKEQIGGNLIDQEIKVVKDKITKYDKIIDHYKHENITCRKLGTVFITFSQQKYTYEILQKHESSFLNILISHTFPKLFNYSTTISSIPSKQLYYKNIPIIVRRAPAPRQIIWENLSFSYTRYIVTEVLAVFTMGFVLALAFKIQVYFGELKDQVDGGTSGRNAGSEDDDDGVVEAVEAGLMAIVIMSVNLGLRFVIKIFVNFKKHYSHSRYQSSFCLYYSLMYIFNTCFMIYIIHINNNQTSPKISQKSKQSRILLYDIHFLLLINSLSDPLYKLLNPFMWSRYARRRYISSLPQQQNPYPQAYINQLWQQFSISNVDNYQYIFRVLVVTVWFVYVAPLGVVISLFGYACDYWISKYILLRWAKVPETVSKRIAVPMIKFLPLLALVYLCGVVQYVYKVSDQRNLFSFIFGFFSYGIIIFVLIAIVAGYYFIRPPPKSTPNSIPYLEAQQNFDTSYYSENPMNKIKSDIKYISYHNINRSTIKSSTKLFNDYMMLNSKNAQSFSERQSEMNVLKRKKLKKLQTMQIQLKKYNKSKNKDKRNSFDQSSDQSSSSIDED